MRKIFIILFSFLTISLSATNYYIKSTGNDSYTGLSDAQAWATITKVNNIWLTGIFAPGDSILFKRGSIFYGTLVVAESGINNNNIVVGAYGTGVNPILSGFQILNSWDQTTIFRHALTPESRPNILLLNGLNTPLGRYPNTGYLDVENATTTSLTDTELQASPNFSGGEVVIRTWYWMMEKSTISTHNGTLITHGSNHYAPASGYGYFIQNDYDCLTSLGEWSYANNYLYMYFGIANPNNYEIKVSVRDEVIKINGHDYITITGLTIEGGNARNINLLSADYITIDNCKIRFSGANGVQANSSCSYTIVRNSEITESNNVGIYLGGGPYATISRNYISRSGYYPGMGGSGDQDYSAIISRGSYGTITYNDIYDSGYDGIVFGGQGTNVSYNYIDGACTVKDDGGGIYSYRDYNTGKTINFNIILNVEGADEAIGEGNDRANGIYNDGSYNTTYSNNIIAHCYGGGIFVNACKNTTVTYNTLYDNSYQLRIISQNSTDNIGVASGHIINNNILFSRSYDGDWLQTVLRVDYIGLAQHDYGVQDYNYFIRPINDDNYVSIWPYAWQWNPNPRLKYNLTEWQSYLSEDSHSKSTPLTISSTNEIHFIYNDSSETKTYVLSNSMIDARGTTYSGTVTLSSYNALILIGSGTVIESTSLVPTVFTTEVTNIGSTTAVSGGYIISDNGYLVTSRGVCWNTIGIPTILNNKTSNGSGIGTFTSNITGLTPSTTYYIRAYAINSQGIAYGNTISFFSGNIPSGTVVIIIDELGNVIIDGSQFVID